MFSFWMHSLVLRENSIFFLLGEILYHTLSLSFITPNVFPSVLSFSNISSSFSFSLSFSMWLFLLFLSPAFSHFFSFQFLSFSFSLHGFSWFEDHRMLHLQPKEINYLKNQKQKRIKDEMQKAAKEIFERRWQQLFLDEDWMRNKFLKTDRLGRRWVPIEACRVMYHLSWLVENEKPYRDNFNKRNLFRQHRSGLLNGCQLATWLQLQNWTIYVKPMLTMFSDKFTVHKSTQRGPELCAATLCQPVFSSSSCNPLSSAWSFQPLVFVQTSFLIGAWQWSRFNSWSLLTDAYPGP